MARYFIHNTARSPHTRLARMQAPMRAKMKQHVGGEIRVLRARPVEVSEETLKAHLPELLEKEKLGFLQVRTGDGRRVDLSTMRTMEDVPVTPPLPNPPADSIANDATWGEKIPQFHGGLPEVHEESTGIPSLVAQAEPEEVLQEPEGEEIPPEMAVASEPEVAESSPVKPSKKEKSKK